MLKKWEELPECIRIPEVKKYYELLTRRKFSLVLKRVFDVLMALMLLIILGPLMVVIAVVIKVESPGEIFFRQTRVTTYGKEFRIHKFRTMIANADRLGTQITVNQDSRITRIGKILRKYRLDEMPQLIDVLEGNMSFVGTRPEVPSYVQKYSNEMKATLLMPAGITSEASIRYKDEAKLLDGADNVDFVYVNEILPAKMKYNLLALSEFSFKNEILTMLRTVLAVMGKNYE